MISPWICFLCNLCNHRRSAGVDECDCDKLDFVAARTLNKDGLNRFVQDRTIIAALNDRLVRLIELVRTNYYSSQNHISTLFPLCCVMLLFLVNDAVI